MAHSQEYISTVNVLSSALDADLLPHDETFTTKDFATHLPSCVKNQALRDARSVFKRSLELEVLPLLKKPLCQWNNQNWHIKQGILTLPVSLDGKTQQIQIKCAEVKLAGLPGLLRLKKKRGKGTRFFGNGRYQRVMRRQFYARRKQLQKARKTRAIRKSKGKEARWMKNINHQLSRQIVTHAQEQGIGTIKVEALHGIRKGTTSTSRGASARKNNRMKNTWSFSQLTAFLTYKAARVGIKVEQVDPAYTSQECPACGARNKAQDRTYVCAECGWRGHRDSVGAINISRRAGLSDQRRGATES